MTNRRWPEQRAVEVGDGVVAVLHGTGEAGVSNAGLIVDGTDALVVDTMMFPAMAEGIRAEVTRRGATPALVINTHPHIDHVGGNAAFADTRVVAHPVAAATVRATGLPVGIFDAFMPAFRGEFSKLGEVSPPADLDPTVELPRDAVLRSFVPAHTSSDTAVWLGSERVLFTGDLCFFGVAPLAIQGLVSGWIAALSELIALAPAVVVPGHGPIGTVDDITRLMDHFVEMMAVAKRATDAGATIEEAHAEFDPGAIGDWLEAERIKPNLERAMQEQRGEVTATKLDALPQSASALLHY